MKLRSSVLLLAITGLLFSSSLPTLLAAPPTVVKPPAAYQGRTSTGQIKPPRPPGPRLGPRYRGERDRIKALPQGQFDVLAPEEGDGVVGYTSSPFPVLYWTLRSSNVAHAVLKIADPKAGQTVMIVAINPAALYSGIQRTPISATGQAGLLPGTVYRWWIEVSFRDGSSAVAGSAIMHVPFGTKDRPEAKCGANMVCIAQTYAAMGYWYDALSTLSPSGSPPPDAAQRSLWEQLLAEIGFIGSPQ
jgi:hypothetical protein